MVTTQTGLSLFGAVSFPAGAAPWVPINGYLGADMRDAEVASSSDPAADDAAFVCSSFRRQVAVWQ